LWTGGPAERWGAWLILASTLLYSATAPLHPASKVIVQLSLDGATALGLLVVALRYGSSWIGVVMLLYALQFTLHAYYFVANRPIDQFHIQANNTDFAAVILSLVIGTVVSWRARLRAA
ncbi:MAG: hypothetical protein ABI655_04100, partial [Phenylobacterium sp.]